jgi:hypothetical protein
MTADRDRTRGRELTVPIDVRRRHVAPAYMQAGAVPLWVMFLAR